MAIPKRRQSKTRSRKRRSHDAVKPLQLQYCPSCGQATPSHTVCPSCGYYMGRTVVSMDDE